MQNMFLVLSNWDFGANNSPERIARALALNGRKVLYARNPLSFFKNPRTKHYQIAPNLNCFDTRFLGLRVGRTFMAEYQWHHLARSLERHAQSLGGKISHVFYHDAAALHALSFLKYFKAKQIKLVHLNIDVIEPDSNARMADLILSIPPLSFAVLKSKYGSKAVQIPQCGPMDVAFEPSTATRSIPQLKNVSGPILTYLGDPSNRMDAKIFRAIIDRNPSWNLLHFGIRPFVDKSNVILLPWMPSSEINAVLAKTNAGIMPYNCSEPRQFGCVPLKLFDFFRLGIPVVSTPIDYTRYVSDLLYVGATEEDFLLGIKHALSEEKASPKKKARQLLTNTHSPAAVGCKILTALADLENCNPY